MTKTSQLDEAVADVLLVLDKLPSPEQRAAAVLLTLFNQARWDRGATLKAVEQALGFVRMGADAVLRLLPDPPGSGHPPATGLTPAGGRAQAGRK